MRGVIFLAAFAWLAVFANPVASAGSITVTPGDSGFGADFPDPAVLVDPAGYFAYGTQPHWLQSSGYFPILRSYDLKTWSFIGTALAEKPAWAVGDFWGPDVIRHGSGYLLYYSALSVGGPHCIAVATGTGPYGPFADRGPIACGDGSGWGYIDPAPLLTSDGRGYLYLSVDDPRHTIAELPLAPDLLSVSGPRRDLFGVTQDWERGTGSATVEAPSVIQRGSLYYLFYSGNDWRSDYGMGYAISRSPEGPFVKSILNPVLRGGSKLTGPGGGSVFEDEAGGVHIAFHAWGTTGRTLRLANIQLSSQLVHITT